MDRTRPLRPANDDGRDDGAKEICDARLDTVKGEATSLKLTEGEVISDAIEALRLMATAAAMISEDVEGKGESGDGNGTQTKASRIWRYLGHKQSEGRSALQGCKCGRAKASLRDVSPLSVQRVRTRARG